MVSVGARGGIFAVARGPAALLRAPAALLRGPAALSRAPAALLRAPAVAPAAVAVAVSLSVVLSGCGSSARTLKAPCQASALAAAAAALGAKPAAVKATVSTGSNGSPQCTYAAGGRAIVANIDVTSQAYFIVERTAIEASQQFAPIPQATLPVQVDHVGLEAFWFPAFRQFETTDGVRVIQVTVNWRGASQARERQVATAVGRTYLGKLHPPP